MKVGTQILYSIGVFLGIIAIAYFGTEVLLGLSPEVKAGLLFFLFATFIVLATIAGELESLTYALAAAAYFVFIMFVLGNFYQSSTVIFLLLAGSSVLFVSLGYLESKDRLVMRRRTVAIVLLCFVVIGTAGIVVDMFGAQPTQETTTVGELQTYELNESYEVTVGEATVTNDHFFSRNIQLEPLTACIYDGTSKYEEGIDYWQGNRMFWEDRLTLRPGESQTVSVSIDSWAFQGNNGLLDGFKNVSSIPVTKADTCPDTADDPQIIIKPGPGGSWNSS